MRRLASSPSPLVRLPRLSVPRAGGDARAGDAAHGDASARASRSRSRRDARRRVTKLDPGTYDIKVHDLSEEHNFHLTGPGVRPATEVGETGNVTWTVTFRDGTYRYVCDPHRARCAARSRSATSPTPPPTPPPPRRRCTSRRRSSRSRQGPGFTITLKTAAGKAVKTMRAGTYTVVVRDRSPIHNAHLIAPGYNRETSRSTYRGTQTWKVRLAQGRDAPLPLRPARGTDEGLREGSSA